MSESTKILTSDLNKMMDTITELTNQVKAFTTGTSGMYRINTDSMDQDTHDNVHTVLYGIGLWCCDDCYAYNVSERMTKMDCEDLDVRVCRTCRGKD
jgi:hypothetical protein